MIAIRPLQIADEAFLEEMRYEAIYIPQNKPPQEELLSIPDIRRYSESWGRNGDCVLVAVDEHGQQVGAAWYRLFSAVSPGYGFVNEHMPELGIAVRRTSRGQGIGKQLITAIAKEAAAKGYEGLSLSVDARNEAAMGLYKKMGFTNWDVSGSSWTMYLRF